MVDVPSEYTLPFCDHIFILCPVVFGFEVELGFGCPPAGFHLLPGLAIALSASAIEPVLLAEIDDPPLAAGGILIQLGCQSARRDYLSIPHTMMGTGN
jgi:hypothetical protein